MEKNVEIPRLCQINHLCNTFRLFFIVKLSANYKKVILFSLLIYSLWTLCTLGTQEILTLHLLYTEYFRWNSYHVTFFILFSCSLTYLGSLLTAWFLLPRVGKKWLILIATVSAVFDLLLTGLSQTDLVMYFGKFHQYRLHSI